MSKQIEKSGLKIFFSVTAIAIIVSMTVDHILYRLDITDKENVLTELTSIVAKSITVIDHAEMLRGSNTPRYDRQRAVLNVLVAKDQIIHIKSCQNDMFWFGNSLEYEIGLIIKDEAGGFRRVAYLSKNGQFLLNDSKAIGEPMQHALNGESGTIQGPDYKGAQVLAAYTYVPELDIGITTKTGMYELRRPFVWIAIATFITAIGTISVSAWLVVKLIRPVLTQSKLDADRLKETMPSSCMLSNSLAWLTPSPLVSRQTLSSWNTAS